MVEKMIFLDFDGVLFNTVKEAYASAVISSNIYQSIDEIDFDSKHYADFLSYRYLLGPAWNYKYILEFLVEKDFLKHYKEKLKSVHKSEYEDFEIRFFETREKLKKNDFQNWFSLNESYPFLDKIKPLLQRNKDLFCIVTTKDKATVTKLLQTEDIKIADNSIYDQKDFESYGNKADIINTIISDRNIDVSIFVDDSRKHLDICKQINNLQLIQADWGYIAVDDIDVENVGEVVLKINNLIAGSK